MKILKNYTWLTKKRKGRHDLGEFLSVIIIVFFLFRIGFFSNLDMPLILRLLIFCITLYFYILLDNFINKILGKRNIAVPKWFFPIPFVLVFVIILVRVFELL